MSWVATKQRLPESFSFNKGFPDLCEVLPTPYLSCMNTYLAFYRGKQLEVKAETSFAAQQLAAKSFKAKKSFEVNVMLTEKDGKPYVHDTASL